MAYTVALFMMPDKTDQEVFASVAPFELYEPVAFDACEPNVIAYLRNTLHERYKTADDVFYWWYHWSGSGRWQTWDAKIGWPLRTVDHLALVFQRLFPQFPVTRAELESRFAARREQEEIERQRWLKAHKEKRERERVEWGTYQYKDEDVAAALIANPEVTDAELMERFNCTKLDIATGRRKARQRSSKPI